MTDYVENMNELRKLKRLMRRGDQRELARRLETMPNKVANAFDGFIKDLEFLKRLRNETQRLLEEVGITVQS